MALQAAIIVAVLFFGVLIGGYMMSGGNEPTAEPAPEPTEEIAVAEPTIPPTLEPTNTPSPEPTAAPALGNWLNHHLGEGPDDPPVRPRRRF